MADSQQKQRGQIQRRWSGLEAVGLRRQWEKPWPPEQEAFLRVVWPLLLAWPLESRGFLDRAWFGRWPGEVVVVGLLILAGGNAALLHRYLEHRGAHLRELRLPLRWLCWGLLAVPLLGFLICPLLLQRLRTPPAWALRPVAGAPRLDLGRFGSSPRFFWAGPAVTLRGFERSWGWLAWLFGANSLGALGTVAWLARPGVLSPAHRLAILATACALHGFAVFALGRLAWRRAEEVGGVQGGLWRLVPFAGVSPMPWAMLALLPVAAAVFRPRESSLVTTAFETAGSARQLSAWSRGGEAGWGEAGSRRRLEAHPVELVLGGLCAAKIAWLWPEALLLGRLWRPLTSWAEEVGWPIRVDGEALGWGVLAALVLAGLIALGEVLLRWRGPHYGRYLFTASGAAASGVWVGLALGAADPRSAGQRLFLAGTLLAVLSLGWIILLGFAGGARFKPGAAKGSLAWLGAACTATYLGAGMLRSPEVAATACSVMEALAAVSPLGSLLLGGWLHPRLLKPFGVQQVLDPELPRALRWKLGLLTCSLFSPLGGLAVPYWLWARHRAIKGTACKSGGEVCEVQSPGSTTIPSSRSRPGKTW